MSRPRRIHVPGGTYYVRQSGSETHPLFTQPDDYNLLEQLLPETLESAGAKLHAYCWTPRGIHLAVTIRSASVARFMQSLNGQYARKVLKRLGRRGHFFQFRHNEMLIPDSHLAPLVQYIHQIPVLSSMVDDPDDYFHSSHRAYLGASHPCWLHTATLLKLLNGDSRDARPYLRLMSEPCTPELVMSFESNDQVFQEGSTETEVLASAHRTPAHVSLMRMHEITNYACRLLDVSREHLFSKSRERRLALARALIAWHVQLRGAGTLGEVAKFLNRDPSTLSQRIKWYRSRQPDLFKADVFHPFVPIGSPILDPSNASELSAMDTSDRQDVVEKRARDPVKEIRGRAGGSQLRVGFGA